MYSIIYGPDSSPYWFGPYGYSICRKYSEEITETHFFKLFDDISVLMSLLSPTEPLCSTLYVPIYLVCGERDVSTKLYLHYTSLTVVSGCLQRTVVYTLQPELFGAGIVLWKPDISTCGNINALPLHALFIKLIPFNKNTLKTRINFCVKATR